MPDSNLIAAKDMRYGTRMLKAGDPLTLDGPKTRLYRALGAVRDPTDAEAKKLFGAPRGQVDGIVAAEQPKPAAKKAPAKKKAPKKAK